MMNNTMFRTSPRPLGISIIAILVAIDGILALLSALFTFTGLGFYVSRLPPGAGTLLLIFGIVALIVGIVSLFLARGLWLLQPWAFWATIILEIVNIIQIVSAKVTGAITLSGMLISLIVPVIILVYFLADRNVRAAFHVSY